MSKYRSDLFRTASLDRKSCSSCCEQIAQTRTMIIMGAIRHIRTVEVSLNPFAHTFAVILFLQLAVNLYSFNIICLTLVVRKKTNLPAMNTSCTRHDCSQTTHPLLASDPDVIDTETQISLICEPTALLIRYTLCYSFLMCLFI